MSNIREKLDPTCGAYGADEIAEDLGIPVDIILRIKNTGLITTTAEGLFTMKAIRFLQAYWSANADKLMRNSS
jgi:hypothetical protein